MSSGKRITLLTGMQPAEEFSTLVHELAREMLHRSERRTLTTKQVRETEAEAVAFVVCQSLGLETGSASADYIQLWNGSAKLLQESLEVVQRAAVILGGIAPKPLETEQLQEPEAVTPEPQPQPEFDMLVEDYLRPAAVKAGILSDTDPCRFGFHNLRHSLASFLVRTKTDPKTVQALLRHSDVKTTLQLYAHSVPEDRMLAQGEVLQAILGSSDSANCGLTAD